MKRILALLLALVLTFGLFACAAMPLESEPLETLPVLTEPVVSEPLDTEPVETEPVETEPIETEPAQTEPEETEALLDPDGWYYSAEEVALYLVTYGELPGNFITRTKPGTWAGRAAASRSIWRVRPSAVHTVTWVTTSFISPP